MVEPGSLERVDEPPLERQPEALVVRRVLGLGIDADRAVVALRIALRQRDHFLERRYAELPVELLRAVVERLNRAQRAELREGEVGDEPAEFWGPTVDHRGALAVGELGMLGDVGGGGDVGLVARDQVTVLGRDEIRLDVVRAELDRERVARKRVVGEVAGGSAVPDHERVWLIVGGGGGRGEDRRQYGRDQDLAEHGSSWALGW